MTHARQILHAADGMTLRLVRTAAETDGELLEMEATSDEIRVAGLEAG